ncbi:ribbon-helix-helix domain-containing protein [Nitratireductor aquimarinus]|uniref:Ribbon-helix-helix domain-containing protein n=1 Tax=Nitratireductor aquimarinus TaxID=889300 RepID=A0ABU4AKZ0_9HYPH|nr:MULTISPECIES: ribbon-helix-helix domain-containing protein [Nitratireductor]MDV6226922.1 ribbon-helix-helix domain-containing protein [Nitratireductor aquimarinus]
MDKAVETHGEENWAFQPRFRVLRVGAARRGIRLEEIFWSSLQEIADEKDCSVGDVIEACENRLEQGSNLTSALRVETVSHLQGELDLMRARTGRQAVRNMVMACPSPCFALAGDRQLMAHNPPFIAFVQSRLSSLPSDATARGVRLSLDIQFSELIEKLKMKGSGPAMVGFVIGVDRQLIRGRLNAILAPLAGLDAIVGFILPN